MSPVQKSCYSICLSSTEATIEFVRFMKRKKYFLLFLVLILVLRTIYGLTTEIWETDELHTYLLGLQFYCKGSWPFFGPRVVYNAYYIPGALQSLLVGIPIFIAPFPESPIIFLNLLTFAALGFLCWYFEKRIPGLPRWLIWGLVMTLPWSVQFGTRVINPSYLLVFSILFFIGFFEMLPIYKEKLVRPAISCLMMGFALTCSMQIHLSWVLLLPFILTCLISGLNKGLIRWKHIVLFLAGALAGLLTLLPTLILYGLSAYKGAGYYLSFQKEGLTNFFIILGRFLSFATYELVYFAGIPRDHLIEVRESPWMLPCTLIVLVFGFIQLAFFIISFFMKRNQPDWKWIKWISFFSVVMLSAYFVFSRKGPSSHTFYILYPLALYYSMYCYQKIYNLRKYFKPVFIVVIISGVIFLAGLARYKFLYKSLYVDREIIQKAIQHKDYRPVYDKARERWKARESNEKLVR
jgi:hypothetical protein